jgi:hypothetical protein
MYMPLSLKKLTQGIRGDGVFLNLVFFLIVILNKDNYVV